MSESLADLMLRIERVTPEGGTWCTVEKAQTLAAIVVALRPQRIVELGVWQGGSLIPMLLALQHLQIGMGVAIDPWAAPASVVGQTEENKKWWNAVDHEAAFEVFRARLARHKLLDLCAIVRRTTDEAPPMGSDLLHVDANHGEQAIRDVERFAPRVSIGGILVLDDLDWEGGHVRRAHAVAKTLGFVDMYPLGSGVAMRRAG